MTGQVASINKITPKEIIEATGRAIGRQRREINEQIAEEITKLRKGEIAALRTEVATLRQIVEALPIKPSTLPVAETRVKAAIAEWYLAKSISPKVSLHMREGSRVNLAAGRKLSDHLRMALLRTVEHMLGGDPVDVTVRGHPVRMPKTCVALIQRSADARVAAKGLRGDMRGDAKTLRLASLLADARLLLGADLDAIEEVEVAVEDVADTLIEGAQRCEDGAVRLAKLYTEVRRAQLEKADGLVPALAGDIEAEFERLSGEYENALAGPAAGRSDYRMRHLSDCD